MVASWACSDPHSDSWGNFSSKSKNCKRALLAWKKLTFKNVVEINKLKSKLQFLLNTSDSSTNREEVKRTRNEVDVLWKQDEMCWIQSLE